MYANGGRGRVNVTGRVAVVPFDASDAGEARRMAAGPRAQAKRRGWRGGDAAQVWITCGRSRMVKQMIALLSLFAGTSRAASK